MKTLLIFLLVVGCNASDFSDAVSESKQNAASDADSEAAGILAEGMNYEGDPIVLKDPPDDNFALYTKISSQWNARVVATKSGSHELNGTARHEWVTIESIVEKRQSVQSVSQISRLSRPAFIRRQPGQNSATANESFTQENRGILDILLAIDNSGSMYNEIEKVRENLAGLLTHVGNSNWQIAMVKSDPSSHCLVEGRITSQTIANDADAYTKMLTFELEGGNEHMLKKVRWALEGGIDQCDGSWLREGSTVAVIVVSDEKHQCPDKSVCSPNSYNTFVNAFVGHDLKTYGFIDYWKSAIKKKIFALHGPATGDYSTTLQTISANIQANLKDIFTLAAIPDGKSMTVSVDNNDVPSCNDIQTSNCYKVVSATDGSAVQFFGYTPPQNASIDIDYTYGGIDFEREWELPYDPLPDVKTMTVSVTKADGTSTTLVRDTDYTLDGRVLRVTSSSVVPQGATLRVDYLENQALQTEFTLTDDTGRLQSGATIVPNTVEVKISDGSGTTIKTLTSGFSFDGTTLTFTDKNHAPAAGISGTVTAQQFTIAYDYSYGKETSYSFSEHQEHLPNSTLSCHNKTQDNSIDCVSDSSKHEISFTDDVQFAVGNEIDITEQLLQQGENFSLLGTGWINNEDVELALTGEGSCTIPKHFIVSDEVLLNTMTTTDCSFTQYLQPDKKQMVDYTYRVYRPEVVGFLQMKKSFFSDHYGKYKFEYWKVLINNNERTNQFTVKDYRVVFDAEVELDKNSTVGVTVYLYHAL